MGSSLLSAIPFVRGRRDAVDASTHGIVLFFHIQLSKIYRTKFPADARFSLRYLVVIFLGDLLHYPFKTAHGVMGAGAQAGLLDPETSDGALAPVARAVRGGRFLFSKAWAREMVA